MNLKQSIIFYILDAIKVAFVVTAFAIFAEVARLTNSSIIPAVFFFVTIAGVGAFQGFMTYIWQEKVNHE